MIPRGNVSVRAANSKDEEMITVSAVCERLNFCLIPPPRPVSLVYELALGFSCGLPPWHGKSLLARQLEGIITGTLSRRRNYICIRF